MPDQPTVERTTTVPGLSPPAARIIHELITVRGLSYANAITLCEGEAEAAAAPHREVAAHLRECLDVRARNA